MFSHANFCNFIFRGGFEIPLRQQYNGYASTSFTCKKSPKEYPSIGLEKKLFCNRVKNKFATFLISFRKEKVDWIILMGEFWSLISGKNVVLFDFLRRKGFQCVKVCKISESKREIHDAGNSIFNVVIWRKKC